MTHLNVEIKARCPDPDAVRAVLRECGAEVRGTDRQIDTYFQCPSGRLKLRQGRIENALIHYDRPDQAGPKTARVTLCRTTPQPELKAVLTAALGVAVVVEKTREIYFIDNVKVHLDRVDGLGSFVEIEAIDETGRLGADRLRDQCRHTMDAFGIDPGDLLEDSYADMIARARGQAG